MFYLLYKDDERFFLLKRAKKKKKQWRWEDSTMRWRVWRSFRNLWSPCCPSITYRERFGEACTTTRPNTWSWANIPSLQFSISPSPASSSSLSALLPSCAAPSGTNDPFRYLSNTTSFSRNSEIRYYWFGTFFGCFCF